MQDTPLFSILIANYNNGKYLKEAIDSVREQTYKNWEIILVDDGSTDCSNLIYKELEDENKIRIFYNQENNGCGFTKHRCIEEANGEICGFLDPDDKLTTDAIDKMVIIHKNMPDVSLVYSSAYYCDANMIVQHTRYAAQDVAPNNIYFFNLESHIGHFSTFKKSYYNMTEGIDVYLRRAVDQDLYLKLYDVGHTFFLDLTLYFYRIHDRGISTLDNIDKALFWHWVVIINIAKKRNINIENLFCENYFPKILMDQKLEKINSKYLRLKKYEKINNFLSSLRKKIHL